MKKRWKILGGLALAGLLAAAAPVVWIETQCTAPLPELSPLGYKGQLTGPDTRPEAATWLTYPEWHIVYSAESYARHLTAGKRPSSYEFGRDIAAFWSSYCRLNRVAEQAGGSSHYKTVIYTIGISFSAEMLVKAAWENTAGRLFEAASGWTSADDRHAARVQTDYAAFMHETPWYRFPFGQALSHEWQTSEPRLTGRHWERRIALSLEYGVKAGYAKLIGWATGTALGADEVRLRMLARPGHVDPAAILPELKVVAEGDGLIKLDAPRYARFTTILEQLSETDAELVEIAGNDDILVTFRAPDALADKLGGGPVLIDMALGDRPGWRRVGVSTKVAQLLPLLRSARASGAELEHVYDY